MKKKKVRASAAGEPREPKTWKRPRLYFQFGRDGGMFERIRILYPDGSSEYEFIDHLDADLPELFPCWAESWIRRRDYEDRERVLGLDKSPQGARRRMRKYDKETGLPKALFLGEL
jgi:hypothetical protein